MVQRTHGVGTVGAVIVALWAALWGRHIQKEQAKDRAGLYAAYIAAKLERYMDALRTASTGVFFDDLEHHTPNFIRFKRELDAAATDISLDMLAHLIPMDGRAAHRLARGLALVEEVQRSVAMEATRENESGGGYQVSNKRTLELGGQLDEAVGLMSVALSECHSLAAIYAQAPTAEELYGE
ncbi:hypothetical protein [Castellaniella defragrans]|jgi:hypothetical protein|uniref:hypothetical protein n=1 Tax=Castellaniella defragrans TaxID=75697 RepID=UPI0023F0AF48|nr:hypothetical protein [Castellaniella defragrans]